MTSIRSNAGIMIMHTRLVYPCYALLRHYNIWESLHVSQSVRYSDRKFRPNVVRALKIRTTESNCSTRPKRLQHTHLDEPFLVHRLPEKHLHMRSPCTSGVDPISMHTHQLPQSQPSCRLRSIGLQMSILIEMDRCRDSPCCERR